MTPVPFQDLSPEEAERVLRWRNHPEVRRWMLSEDPIPPEKHRTFVRNLAKDPANRYWKVEETGVIYLNRIDRETATGEVGLYANPEEQAPGRGTRLLRLLLEIAFGEMALERVTLEALEENQRALGLYRKFGFRETAPSGGGLFTMELTKERYEDR